MKLRTPLEIPPAAAQITYGQRLLALGSCFAGRMGERLAASKLDILVNPLGIGYNPLSLVRLLRMVIDEDLPQPQWADHLEAWCSFDLHSQFNHYYRREFEQEVKLAFTRTQRYLERLDWLLITFGTAWVYYHPSHPAPVNNNHRFPQREFRLELTPVAAIVDRWQALIEYLRQVRPELQVIFTVSPIRHTRHTLPGNSVSKATLRLACHHLEQLEGVSYFPAFEIMIDDLRDYRFYSDDFLHPSELAEAYIWDKFAQTYLAPETRQLMQDLESVHRDLNHRPRQANSEAYRRFLQQLQYKIEALAAKGLDLNAERERLVEQGS